MQYKNWLFVLLALTLPTWVQAQTYPTGLVFDDAAYNDLPRASNFTGSRYGENLPLTYTLKDHAPSIGNQGQIGSCVGWATGYAAYTIASAKMNGITNTSQISQDAYSALYLYNNVKVGSCGDGSRIDDACRFLETDGDLKSVEFDLPVTDCYRYGDESQKTRAREYRIKDYLTLFNINESPDKKVFMTKTTLAEGNPVIIGMSLRNNFFNVRGDEIWDPNSGNTDYAGGHAMCIVGYNEYKKAFLLMNSWGDDWGDGGFGWVSYEDYGEYCKYAYILVLEEKQDPSTSIVGDFIFRYPVFKNNSYTFDEAATKKESGYMYRTVRTDWKIGDQVQLLAKNLRKNEYVYVFSVDPNGRATVHWPRNEELDNTQFDGYKDSPIIISDDAEILIPGENMAMTKEAPGDDYLIILYSDRQIEDFKSIVSSMNYSQNDVEGKLIGLLNDRVPASQSIDYKSNQMGFTASLPQGSIVPIILKAEGK